MYVGVVGVGGVKMGSDVVNKEELTTYFYHHKQL